MPFDMTLNCQEQVCSLNMWWCMLTSHLQSWDMGCSKCLWEVSCVLQKKWNNMKTSVMISVIRFIRSFFDKWEYDTWHRHFAMLLKEFSFFHDVSVNEIVHFHWQCKPWRFIVSFIFANIKYLNKAN
jgi:hypothetical protein